MMYNLPLYVLGARPTSPLKHPCNNTAPSLAVELGTSTHLPHNPKLLYQAVNDSHCKIHTHDNMLRSLMSAKPRQRVFQSKNLSRPRKVATRTTIHALWTLLQRCGMSIAQSEDVTHIRIQKGDGKSLACFDGPGRPGPGDNFNCHQSRCKKLDD